MSTSKCSPLIAANWKMHGTQAKIKNLLSELISIPAGVGELVVFPPYIFIPQVQEALINTPVRWGGQNMSSYPEGAHTGEISGAMLREFGCHYVLLGHSERRRLYGELDTSIAQKLRLASELGLTPLFCLGETLAHRASKRLEVIISRQLRVMLEWAMELKKAFVLAYEPLWAIGTGLNATPEQVQTVHAWIRQYVAGQYVAAGYDGNLAGSVRILYGGSVNSGNAKALLSMPDVDGVLVGGASLIPGELLKISCLVN